MQGRPEGVAYRSSDDGVRSQSGLDDSLREEAGKSRWLELKVPRTAWRDRLVV